MEREMRRRRRVRSPVNLHRVFAALQKQLGMMNQFSVDVTTVSADITEEDRPAALGAFDDEMLGTQEIGRAHV